MKILVADDSKTFMAMINASLQNLGHQVVCANSGREAIQLYKDTHPDLVILDVLMPEMNGFECARCIRDINPEDWVPIIFLSATVDDESIANGIEAGGDDYLTKPYSEVTLQAKIKAMQRIASTRIKLYDTMEELKKLTSRDVLTGLYNRFQFELTLREKFAAANRHKSKMALLFIDLDHFKSINDSLGHGYGDLLLKEVSERIKRVTRQDDFVARIGGDEFVVIAYPVDKLSGVGDLAQKLVTELAKEFCIDGNSLKISASIGIAVYPDININESNLVQCADIAMYTAKNMGRNNFQYYTEVLSRHYKKHQGIEHELRFSLERKQISVVYQPIYDLLTKNIVKIEALARWDHPEFGKVSPNIFIPVAEEIGFITELGLWIMRETCKNAAHLVAHANPELKIAINTSIRQFMQTDFVDQVLEILIETGLPPKNLILEVTETTVITYSNSFRTSIARLYEKGIEISIDDFGVKNTSLRSLKYLPVTSIKIDKNFVKNVDHNKKNGIIVKTLIALGENLNVDVIAEGIQTVEQLHFLVKNGCRYGQGFLLCKPVNLQTVTKLIVEGEEISPTLLRSSDSE